MRFNDVHYLLVFLIFCSIFTSAMKCYQCRSDFHDHCEDSVDEDYLKDCETPENQTKTRTQAPQVRGDDDVLCRKISQNCMLYFISMNMGMKCYNIHSSLKYTKRSIMYSKVQRIHF